ncbi:hypothetical protein BC835DRAFT_1306327 [Cytidiella melzeri]|nr:hypothetical protein BC835DRAFT_1306327 [Cytidiella melzeri]
MRSHIAVASMLLATVGPAVSVPIASTVASLDAPSNTSIVAASGNDVDDSATTQLTMSLPVLSMLHSRTIRRRGEPTNFVSELHARGWLEATAEPEPELEGNKEVVHNLPLGEKAASVLTLLKMDTPITELIDNPSVVEEVQQSVRSMNENEIIQMMRKFTQEQRTRLLQLMRGHIRLDDLSIASSHVQPESGSLWDW